MDFIVGGEVKKNNLFLILVALVMLSLAGCVAKSANARKSGAAPKPESVGFRLENLEAKLHELEQRQLNMEDARQNRDIVISESLKEINDRLAGRPVSPSAYAGQASARNAEKQPSAGTSSGVVAPRPADSRTQSPTRSPETAKTSPAEVTAPVQPAQPARPAQPAQPPLSRALPPPQYPIEKQTGTTAPLERNLRQTSEPVQIQTREQAAQPAKAPSAQSGGFSAAPLPDSQNAPSPPPALSSGQTSNQTTGQPAASPKPGYTSASIVAVPRPEPKAELRSSEVGRTSPPATQSFQPSPTQPSSQSAAVTSPSPPAPVSPEAQRAPGSGDLATSRQQAGTTAPAAANTSGTREQAAFQATPTHGSSAAAPPQTGQAPRGAPLGGSEKQLYDQALKMAMAGQTQAARRTFDEFLQKYPNSRNAPNVYYWVGETYYHDGNFSQSVESFDKVVKSYPQSEKSADAMYKIALTYEKMGDRAKAVSSYESLLQAHSNYRLAGMAKEKIRQLSQ